MYRKISPSLYPLIILLILLISIGFNLFSIEFAREGDTLALINGANEINKCIKHSQYFNCGFKVGHFPIFQYIYILALKLITSKDSIILLTIIFTNIIIFIALASKIFYMGEKRSIADGIIYTLFFVTGYISWYSTSSFNECLAFVLFAFLGIALTEGYCKKTTCFIIILIILTKEINCLFVFMIILTNIYLNNRKIKEIKLIILNNIPYLFSILLGVIINILFNIFRFGTFRNLPLLDDKFLTPENFILNYFYQLFFSPAAGLLYVWPLLLLMLIYPILSNSVKNKFVAILLIFMLLILNFGLAHWYSPFGWYSWGPRLTLPLLGFIYIYLIYYYGEIYTKKIKIIINKIGTSLFSFFFIIIISPNLALRWDSWAYFKAISTPSEISYKHNIVPLYVDSVDSVIFALSELERFNRRSILDFTLEVFSNYQFLGSITFIGVYILFSIVNMSPSLKKY